MNPLTFVHTIYLLQNIFAGLVLLMLVVTIAV